MKRLARFLRSLANHIDPPKADQKPTQSLRIQVTAETGAAQAALAQLATEMETLRSVTASAATESLLRTAVESLRRRPWTWTDIDHGLYAAALAVLRRAFGLGSVECRPQDDGHHLWRLGDLTVVSHPELPALVVLAAAREDAPGWLRAISAELTTKRMVRVVAE